MRALQVTLSVLLLATLVTASTHFQVIGANADTVFLQDKAISFVKNVLPFNISHYSIGVSESYFLSDPNDTTTTQVVIVDLNSTDSMVRVSCLF
jgi:hypothetical protein